MSVLYQKGCELVLIKAFAFTYLVVVKKAENEKHSLPFSLDK